MVSIKNVLRILSTVVLIYSASEADEEIITLVIDINEDYYDSNLTPKIDRIIPLKTTEASQFGDLSSAEINEGRIYLLDRYRTKTIYAFDLNGNFINKTKPGKGPTEIIEPISFFIDQQKNQIVVYDQMLTALIAYDQDLNHLSRAKHTGLGVYDIDLINNGDYLIRNRNEFAYVLYDSDFKIKDKFIVDKEYKSGQDLLNTFTSHGSRALIIAPHDYYLYEFANNRCEKKFYLDFGDYNLNDDEISKGIWPLVNAGKRVSGPMGIAETESFIWFYVVFNREIKNYLLNKGIGKLTHLNEYFAQKMLPETEIFGILGKDSFFGLVDPSDLIEFQDQTGKKLVSGEAWVARLEL